MSVSVCVPLEVVTLNIYLYHNISFHSKIYINPTTQYIVCITYSQETLKKMLMVIKQSLVLICIMSSPWWHRIQRRQTNVREERRGLHLSDICFIQSINWKLRHQLTSANNIHWMFGSDVFIGHDVTSRFKQNPPVPVYASASKKNKLIITVTKASTWQHQLVSL